MHVKAALDDKGKPTAWLQRSVFPTLRSTFSLRRTASGVELAWVGRICLSSSRIIERKWTREESISYRLDASVANIYHAFAIHSFVDELARLAKRDRSSTCSTCLARRARSTFGKSKSGITASHWISIRWTLADCVNVIEVAAERSGWGKKKPAKGRALGIAAHRSFLTYVAAVVEVDVDATGNVRIPRVDIAVDAGRVINPDRVKAQFEGASVFGASIAMIERNHRVGRAWSSSRTSTTTR